MLGTKHKKNSLSSITSAEEEKRNVKSNKAEDIKSLRDSWAKFVSGNRKRPPSVLQKSFSNEDGAIAVDTGEQEKERCNYGFLIDEKDKESYVRWLKDFKQNCDKQTVAFENVLRDETKISSFCQDGIPMSLRSFLWKNLTGVEQIMKMNSGLYEKLKMKGNPSEGEIASYL